MLESLNRSWGSQLLRTAAGVFRVSDWTLNRIDPDGLRYVATVSVWAHWFIAATFLVLLVYRPWYGPGRYAAFGLLFLLLLACNGYVHYRLASNRTLTWLWMFALCVADVALVSGCAVLGGGFSHYFFHLLYYPVLAGFAVFFTSFRLNMAFVTLVAAIYLTMSLTVGEGIDLEAREEKPLFARIVIMYAVGASVNLISRFERIRWRAAVERERELHRQRIEISQTIHDTTAQWAYMIGLGVEGAMELVEESQEALKAKLPAGRRPVPVGHVGPATPHRRRAAIPGRGAWGSAGSPRRDLHRHHIGSRGVRPARYGAGPANDYQEPAVLHSPQRPDQRGPAR